MSDAQLLLGGSPGQIGTVILVKIQPLLPGEQEIKSAFLQVYHYDAEHGEAVPKEGREQLLPPPESHELRGAEVDLSWDELLMNQVDGIPRKSANPSPLYLDDLRGCINGGLLGYLDIHSLKLFI